MIDSHMNTVVRGKKTIALESIWPPSVHPCMLPMTHVPKVHITPLNSTPIGRIAQFLQGKVDHVF